MEYTPSQKLKIIEKQKPVIFKALETIDENAAYISTDEGYNILCQMYVDGALQKLSKAFEIVSDIIIDTDDYPLGVEIFEKLMPIWRKYCTEANKGKFRIHEAAHQVQGIINYFQKWIKEKEPKTSVNDSLGAFENLAHECIAFIGLKYGTRKVRPKSQKLILKQRDSYQEIVSVSELTYEIKRHIESCKTPSEVDQYICSLLLPFKELCEVLRPSTPTSESQKFIRLLCTGVSYHGKDDPDSIERVLRSLLDDMNKFAKGLYDVLIQNGIDLNEYQEKTGVYLRKKWNPSEGTFFELDNWDLIENLPLVETIEQQEEKKEIKVPRRKKEKQTITRTINESKLEKCFTAKFRGAGNNIDFFAQLVSKLKDLQTQTECRAVATMIWKSKEGFYNMFTTYSDWCRYFFDCIECKVPDDYNWAKKEEPDERLKQLFSFFNMVE